VIGNDAGWTQIARDQVEILHDDVGTVLRYNDYHKLADALDAKGVLVDKIDDVDNAVKTAKKESKKEKAVLINALLGKTDFRKGSMSL